MTQALITINASPGSNADLPIGTLVTLGNVDNGGELTYSWSILEQPPGPVNNLSSPTAPAPTFTPTKEGSYLIQLIVNIGLPDEKRDTVVAAVLQLRTRTRVPAAGEVDEVSSTKGWSLSANELLRIVDAVRADPMLTVAILAYTATAGDVVKFSAADTIMAGLPGEEAVAAVELTTGLETAVAAGRVGVVVQAVDGGALTNGKLAYVRVGGLVFATVPALTAPGTPLYISDAGTLSITAGTVARQVGRLVALTGTDGTIYLDGASGGGGGASSDILWEWNGTDVSQFGAKVDLGLGPNIAGLDLTTVAGGPAGTLLRVSSSELDVGGVAWPILQALPRRYVIEIEYWLVNFSDVSDTGNNLGGVVVMADSTLDNVVAFASLNPTTEDELYLGNIAISSGVGFGPAFHLNGSPLGRFQVGPAATPTPTGMRLQYTVEMQRPFSANPRATIRVVGSGYNDAITGAMATETYGNTAGLSGIYPAGWDGLTADTAGLLAGNGAVTTPWSMDIVSMRILKHPADR